MPQLSAQSISEFNYAGSDTNFTTVWNNVRGISSATVTNIDITVANDDGIFARSELISGRGGKVYYFSRLMVYFDTSGITSTVDQAHLIATSDGSLNPGAAGGWVFAKSTGFGGDGKTAGANGDVDSFTSTLYCGPETKWPDAGDTDGFQLNSTALTDMQNNDYLIGMYMHANDHDDTVPTSNWGTAQINGHYRQSSITSIILDYTLAGYGNQVSGIGNSNIAAIDGILTANIGTVIGV